MLRIALALLLLTAIVGCGGEQDVTKPDNPAPPPGRDALITD